MAKLLINPVGTKSSGHQLVTIDGIDPTDHDCLKGSIQGVPGHPDWSWNASGICRGGTPQLNINPNDSAVAEVLELVQMLKGNSGT